MRQKQRLICGLAALFFWLYSFPLVAGTDPEALLQQARNEYATLRDSLVKKYAEAFKRGQDLDRLYYQKNNKNTIRNEVQVWQEIITDGYNTLSGFLSSADFDQAQIIHSDSYFNDALGAAVRNKNAWPDEIGPAWSAAQRCCNTTDVNECRYQLLQKVFPSFRDFAQSIEDQVGGFFRSLDQSRLSYYDDYYKKTKPFTYTWPNSATTLLNFFKGENYNQELQSWKITGSNFHNASLLTVGLNSNEGRSLTMYVSLEFQRYSNAEPWLREYLGNGTVIDESANCLVLKRENSYYRLVHFYKGRKTLAVIYSIDTDKTIDNMVRYLILALRDYVASGGAAPPPSPGPGPAANQQLEVKALTTVNLNSSPGPTNTCTLQAMVTRADGAPLPGVTVVFETPSLGTLSALEVLTDAQGQAQVTYTAPPEAQVTQTGKKEISVSVNAQETKSGAKGYEVLHIRSRTSDITANVEHNILPAHPDYYNTITFRFKAADKQDGSAYRARISAGQQSGALVPELYQKGGTRTYEMDVWPDSDCEVYYHWIGPPSMMKATDEIVTIEIPELGLKQEVGFSVGIDLTIVAVQRKFGGPLFPLFWEPFNVYITDRFHPDADLSELLARFRIKTDLKIEQTSYGPPPVSPAETGFLSALFTRIEGSPLGALHEAVVWDGGTWEAQKTLDKRCVLVQKGQHADGQPWMDYPSIVFWERGTYQFQVALKPGPFDADPRNNTTLTELFTIEAFRGMSDELVHTVFLPSIEFLAETLSGFSKSLSLKYAFCLKSLAGDLHGGKYLDCFTDAWGCSIDVVGNSDLPERIKELLDNHTLALYVKTLCDTMVQNKPAGTTQTPGPGAPAVKGSLPAGYDLEKILEIARRAVQGSRDKYLVILEKDGLQRYAAAISEGEMLAPAPRKLGPAQTPAERIEDGQRFVVIPAGNEEELSLQLNGNGGAGVLIIVTADAITQYAYPSASWQSTVTVDSTGTATSTEGEDLNPMQ
jgi:hypothetical protein